MAKRKKLYKSKKVSYLSLLFSLGLILIVLSIAIKINELRGLAFAGNVPASIVSEKRSNPDEINIKDSGIDLNVKETYILNNSWGISSDGASHLNTSANPGENGNIIVYAHNTSDRFGSLKDVKTGSIITIK